MERDMVERNIELKDMPALSQEILSLLRMRLQRGQMSACIVALSGPLGAGKTTLSQELAHALGVQGAVVSPTFVVEKRYVTLDADFKKMIHIDAYRLETAHELEVLGFADTKKDPHTLILIEWAEKVQSLLPAETYWISLEYVGENGDEGVRRIRYSEQ